MTKFKNLKKALAVSVCSSMLFSGAPKASGMMFRRLISKFTTERSVSVLDWFLGSATSEASFRYSDSLIDKYESNYNANVVGKMYNNVCYLLKKLSDRNLLKGNIKVDVIKKDLYSAELLANKTVKSKFSCLNCILPCCRSRANDKQENIIASKKELAVRLARILNETVDFKKLNEKNLISDVDKEKLDIFIGESRGTIKPDESDELKTEVPHYYLEFIVEIIMKSLNISMDKMDKIDDKTKKIINEKTRIFDAKEVLKSITSGLSNNNLIGDNIEDL